MGMKLREEHTHFFSDHGCGMYKEPFRPLLRFFWLFLKNSEESEPAVCTLRNKLAAEFRTSGNHAQLGLL
jgi:hypothetical protein